MHTLDIRVNNIQFREAGTQKIELASGHDAELVREGNVIDASTPWVVVVIPDGILNEHQEVTGVNPVHK